MSWWQWRMLPFTALWVMLSTVSGPADAHVGDLVYGIDVLPAPDATEVDVEASFGLLMRAETGFSWVCHEAVTAPGVTRPPRYQRSRAGTWAAVLPDATLGRGGATLFTSTDGCDWPATLGLEGRTVTGAAFDPTTEGNVLFAVTASADRDNGIFRSDDGGRTVLADSPLRADRHFSSVRCLADGTVLAAATDNDGANAFLWVKTPALGWVERPIPRPTEVVAPFGAILAGEPTARHVAVVLDQYGPDTLVATADLGLTFATAYVAEGYLSDVTTHEGNVWTLVSGVDLVRIDGDGAAPLPAIAPAVGLGFAGEALFLASQAFVTRALLERSDDGGQTFATVALPDDVGQPLACPPQSDAARVCEPLWEALLPQIRGFGNPAIDTGVAPSWPSPPGRPDTAAPPVEAPRGCGCAQGGLPGWLGLGLWLVGWRRRPGDKVKVAQEKPTSSFEGDPNTAGLP